MEEWLKVSNMPLCSNGKLAGWRPSSAAVLADACGRKGTPNVLAYHAMDPTETAVAEAIAVRDARKGALGVE
jgi:hypothetical protein